MNQAWDAAGRLLSRTYPDASLDVAFTYDATAWDNLGIGRLTGMQDASGVSEYAYDAKGLITRERRVIAGVSHETRYSWGGNGRLWGIYYPSGRLVTFDHDALGRPIYVGLERVPGAGHEAVVHYAGYRPFGPLHATNYANDTYRWTDYDLEYYPYQLNAGLQGGPVLMQRYHWRGDGVNLLSLDDDDIDPAQTQRFTYDDAGRLLTATGPYGTLAWTYDRVGNRLTETRTPPGGAAQARAYAYPATSNRLASVTLGGTTERSFAYDAAGNQTGDTRSGVAYAYRVNAAGRLDQVTVGGSVRGRYTYDGRGRLAVRQRLNATPSGTAHLIHDAFDRVIAETNGAGQVVREYLWLGDLPVAVLDGSANPASPALLGCRPTT